MDGSDTRSTPPEDASALTWPVLARLPWVGEPSAERDKPGTTAVPHGPEVRREPESFGPSSLRIAPTTAEPHPHYADRQHQAVVVHEPMYVATGAEPLSRASAAARRHHRVDAGEVRVPAGPASARAMAAEDLSATLASRVFQWQAILAPYAGVAMTFILALFAGLLYWSTFGRPTLPGNQASEAAGWSQEPSRDEQLSAAPSAAPLSEAQAIRLETPPLESVEDEQAALAAAAPDVEPAASAPALNARPIEKPVAPAPAQEGTITVTEQTPAPPATQQLTSPAPLTISYPTTPFASFDFGLVEAVADSTPSTAAADSTGASAATQIPSSEFAAPATQR